MKNNFLFLSLLTLMSCGQQTTVKSAQLESFSNITEVDSKSVVKAGSLYRGNGTTPDRILLNGQYYIISIYSSYSALEYVAAKPLNYQGQVMLKGVTRASEIALETLRAP